MTRRRFQIHPGLPVEPPYQRHGIGDRVLQLLREAIGPLSTAEVAKELRHPVGNTRDVLRRLAKRGMVRQVGKLERVWRVGDKVTRHQAKLWTAVQNGERHETENGQIRVAERRIEKARKR